MRDWAIFVIAMSLTLLVGTFVFGPAGYVHGAIDAGVSGVIR